MAQDSIQAFRDRLRERPARPVPVPTTTTDVPVLGKACLVVGWSFRETTGSARAAATLVNGSGATGDSAAEIGILSGGGHVQGLGDEGVLCEGGLFLHVVTGSVAGTVYARY